MLAWVSCKLGQAVWRIGRVPARLLPNLRGSRGTENSSSSSDFLGLSVATLFLFRSFCWVSISIVGTCFLTSYYDTKVISVC